MATNNRYRANAIRPYMARSATARQTLEPTFNSRSSAVMAIAGASTSSLAGSTTVGLNSSTAASKRRGSRR
ncbi:hypothetical protein D3C87_1602810 [compost metagenome]